MKLSPSQRVEIIDRLYSRMCAWQATGLQRPLRELAIDYADYVIDAVMYQVTKPTVEESK